MYDVMQAFSPHTWVYFLAAVLIGGFFILNLFLGFVFDEYMRAKASEQAKAELKEKERAFFATKASGDVGDSPHEVEARHEFQRLKEEEDMGAEKGENTAPGGVECLRPIVSSNFFQAISFTFLL